MWHDVEGHDAIVEQFRRSLASGRLATTYLLVGPEGIGKRTFALRLAQSLLCTNQPDVELDFCGQCESCRLMTSDAHPDLDLIARPDGKRRLPVELFIGDREHRNQQGLCHNIALRPRLGKRRVAVIDDADWLTVESANCLLKTLEEPPPGALILMIGTSRSRQLPTILSRSQVVRFNPLSTEIVERLLLAEGLASDAATAARVAADSGGSLAAARRLADGELLALRQQIQRAVADRRFDLSALGAAIKSLIDAAGKDAESRRQRFRETLVQTGVALRTLLRDQCQSGQPVDATLAALEHCLDAEEYLDRNANQATLLDVWLMRLVQALEGDGAAASGCAE